MHLLPSEQESRTKKAIQEFQDIGTLTIYEPCNCGSQIRHNNGGNYHDIIQLRQDKKQCYVKYDTTCELVAPAEWEHCQDWENVIRENADWL